MRRLLSAKLLPYLSYTAGILCAAGMAVLYIAGEDEKGLLPPMHIGWIFACLIGVAGLALLISLVQDLGGKFRYRQLFAPSASAAVGTLAAAVGFASDGLADVFSHGDIYGIICGFFSIVSAIALLFLAHCRRAGQRPTYFIRAFVTVALMLRLICRGGHWTDRELETYLCQLLAAVS